jgi:uncharacterized caspase-like protein
LCVGIDEYDPPHRLAGCVNDANDWAAVLRSFGFDVSLMINGEATWQRLQDALSALITASRPGDVVVFQYAGHGTRVDDVDGDEESGRDSALCPIDYTAGRLLIDDDVRRIVRELSDGVNFTCFARDASRRRPHARFARDARSRGGPRGVPALAARRRAGRTQPA